MIYWVDFRINFALFTNLHNPHCFGKNNLVFVYIKSWVCIGKWNEVPKHLLQILAPQTPPKDIFGEVKIMLGAFLKHTNEAYSPILWTQHFHGAFIKHTQICSYTYTHKLYNVGIDYRQPAQQEVFFEVYALGKF